MSHVSPVPQLLPSSQTVWADAPIPREPQSPVPVGIGGTGGENGPAEKASQSLTVTEQGLGNSGVVTNTPDYTAAQAEFRRVRAHLERLVPGGGAGMKVYPTDRYRAVLRAWGWVP